MKKEKTKKFEINILDSQKTLKALINLDKKKLILLVEKYLSDIEFSEIEFSLMIDSYLNRIDSILTKLINLNGEFSEKKLIQISELFIETDIAEIRKKIEKTKNKINKKSKYISFKRAVEHSQEFLDIYFTTTNMKLIESAKEYIKNRLIDESDFPTERKIFSDLYWIYNEINNGDSVKKITKKGETIGEVVEINNQFFVRVDGVNYPLTSTWKKDKTRLDLTKISADIFLFTMRMRQLSKILKKGPTKAEFVLMKFNSETKFYNEKIAILSEDFIEDLDFPQIVFSDNSLVKSNKNIFNFFDLNIIFNFAEYMSEEQMIDDLIVETISNPWINSQDFA
ncbi:hypothetical protein [Leptospira bouyouniensis]|uniref:hypothetical protein n=1 Tax=Leptospira bouyouniensis TaxID=2484911 RepID=UPI001090E73A|nr:hypothetical protein [Leptospira bouyouniensis]TGM87974.1 hypothetical protein EHQ99_00350 [Leptospira bouyouniensis]